MINKLQKIVFIVTYLVVLTICLFSLVYLEPNFSEDFEFLFFLLMFWSSVGIPLTTAYYITFYWMYRRLSKNDKSDKSLKNKQLKFSIITSILITVGFGLLISSTARVRDMPSYLVPVIEERTEQKFASPVPTQQLPDRIYRYWTIGGLVYLLELDDLGYVRLKVGKTESEVKDLWPVSLPVDIHMIGDLWYDKISDKLFVNQRIGEFNTYKYSEVYELTRANDKVTKKLVKIFDGKDLPIRQMGIIGYLQNGELLMDVFEKSWIAGDQKVFAVKDGKERVVKEARGPGDVDTPSFIAFDGELLYLAKYKQNGSDTEIFEKLYTLDPISLKEQFLFDSSEFPEEIISVYHDDLSGITEFNSKSHIKYEKEIVKYSL
ncbi:MAG: hypothetical protein ACOX6N_01930 [Patescibacteria group bacterium]|jgi:hypothetical protein